jgi:hypothetical protein
MVFFAESSKELKSGVVGFEITLVAKNLQLTSELREFVLPFKSRCGEIETAFDLSFISKKAHPLGVYVQCHGHIDGDRISHFILYLQRKPKSSPPPNLTQTSEKLGGYPSGLLNFFPIMGGQQTQCRASFKGLVIEPKSWPLKITRYKLSKKVGAFTLEQEEINFENKRDETKAVITFMPGESRYFLQIKSTVAVKLNDACFESASEQLWEKANSLFSKK